MSDLELESAVKNHLARIRHWQGFPNERAAMRDYIAAIATCGSVDLVTALMDDLILSETEQRMPSVATFRRLAFDLREKYRTQRRHCPHCEGVGFLTYWYVVTYIGESLKVASARRTDAKNAEEAAEIRRKLFEQPQTVKQDVISAAKRCVCNPGA